MYQKGIPHVLTVRSTDRSDSLLRKRQNIENLENMANLTIKEVNLQDLFTLMIDMKLSQDEMKKNQKQFQNTVQTKITALESKLDAKMESVHHHIENEINEVKFEIMQDREKREEQMKILHSRVYMYFDENPMLIMGDLNGRIGDKQDYNPSIDVGDIQKRCSIDNTIDYQKLLIYGKNKTTGKNSWASEIRSIMNKCELINHYNLNSLLGMSCKTFFDLVKRKLTIIAAENWKVECAGMPKLRTYEKIKSDYCQEPTLLKTLSTKFHALLSKLRSGTFPIETEKRRYRQVPA
ncbi:unnamed protein product [Mytilus coruscus]|uniref:Uncharacterized protein n=1 Tax=Mytilus coruscus TaxID=42192 RepID=A0A6J8A6M5_MYTCO|nr:unnamed protein product [Mytilus coruscus]